MKSKQVIRQNLNIVNVKIKDIAKLVDLIFLYPLVFKVFILLKLRFVTRNIKSDFKNF
jgi:hypothetical protein